MRQGWEIRKMGEVLTIERGGSPRPIEKYMTNSPDGINWIKISDATASEKYIYETKEKITKDGLHKTRVVNEGDFILSNSMSFGRPYIMKTTGCIHDGWLVLKQNGKKIFETEFLYYLLSSPFVFQQFNSKAAGSTVRNLNIALVSSVDVPIPPLSEQQRIVSILEEAFAAIAKAKANAEKNLQNAIELFESYLQGVFEKNEGWEEHKLKDLVSRLTNGYVGQTKNIYQESGIPYLLARHVKNNILIFDERTYVTDAFNQKNKKSILKEGDVLLVQSGHIGHSAVVPEIHAGHNCHAMIVITPKINLISGDFLSMYFLSPFMKEQFENLKTGSTIKHLNCKVVREVNIPLPSLPEQKAIVQNLNSLAAETKKLETIYQQKLDDLEELKKSILQKAFSGELTAKEELV